jgi:membrane AbrB-like protein
VISYHSAMRSAFALMVSLGGATLFLSMGTVLPWMMGPMVAMALASMLGCPVERPALALPVGQLVVGCALGLFFTKAVLAQVWSLTPYLIAASLFAFVLGGLSAALLRKLSGCDVRTAFFASLPGGAAEMSNLASKLGGRADWVAAAHALRIVLVVLTVPPLLTLSGAHGHELGLTSKIEIHYVGLACILFLAMGSGWLLQYLKVPNAWVIGPLLMTALITGLGLDSTAMPRWASNAAQLLIGCALGSRFDKAFLRAGPRFMAAVAMTVYLSIALAAAFGGLLNWVSGIDVPTAILATAPGGVAEMSVTAKVLQFGVPVVTAFHVTRMAFLVLCAGPLFSFYERISTFLETQKKF